MTACSVPAPSPPPQGWSPEMKERLKKHLEGGQDRTEDRKALVVDLNEIRRRLAPDAPALSPKAVASKLNKEKNKKK